MQTGKLDVGNIFVGESAWKSAEINQEIPQVFGRTIANDQELAKVITDAKTLEAARKEAEASGIFPTIYVMNHEARLAYAAYLGGRVPTQEEQKSFWDKLPGTNVLEKATGAGIPLPGCFGAGGRGFGNVGEWAYLVSSSKGDGGVFEGLDLSRGKREADEDWYFPRHGCSFLVMFG